ncbi:MAG TPA: ATP-dependent 6-phosphofructokinase, partial [Longimicrobiales bacterium]
HARRKFGLLTGGGDCPGLNAVIRAAAHRCARLGVELIGYRNGWEGVIDGASLVLDRAAVKGILPLGGTILGTSRTDPLMVPDGIARIRRRLDDDGVDGLIVVGGDGTLSASLELVERGVPLVGVPKTIDNDLDGTDFTFGFDTAVSIATEAIDRLHTTAEAHNRVIVVEVMGRHTGWIAAYSGVAGGADVILVPEYPFEVRAVCDRVQERERRGRTFSIVVIAEGARPSERDGEVVERRARVRPGEISAWLAREMERCIETETRTVVLGHIQRGGSPTAHDRVLATRFGVHAADLAIAEGWGRMVSLRGVEIGDVPLADAVRTLKRLDPAIWDIAKVFAQ